MKIEFIFIMMYIKPNATGWPKACRLFLQSSCPASCLPQTGWRRYSALSWSWYIHPNSFLQKLMAFNFIKFCRLFHQVGLKDLEGHTELVSNAVISVQKHSDSAVTCQAHDNSVPIGLVVIPHCKTNLRSSFELIQVSIYIWNQTHV